MGGGRREDGGGCSSTGREKQAKVRRLRNSAASAPLTIRGGGATDARACPRACPRSYRWALVLSRCGGCGELLWDRIAAERFMQIGAPSPAPAKATGQRRPVRVQQEKKKKGKKGGKQKGNETAGPAGHRGMLRPLCVAAVCCLLLLPFVFSLSVCLSSKAWPKGKRTEQTNSDRREEQTD